MEVILEIAQHVSATNRVHSSGSGSSLSVFTTFLCSFAVDGRQVKLSGREPPIVHAGDDAVLVGEADGSGEVLGICYVNVTRGVGGT